MPVVLTSAAERDVAAVLDWYDAQAPGTGRHFLDALESLLERIAAAPRQFQKVRGEVRRAGIRRFPYHLYFRVRSERVEVFACLHARRSPISWHRRV